MLSTDQGHAVDHGGDWGGRDKLSGQDSLSLSPASLCHVLPNPPETLLATILGGWKSATSPSPSLAPLECFAFSLVLKRFMVSDAMLGREEASGSFESWVHLIWYHFFAPLIPFLSVLSGIRFPSCVVL